MPEGKSNYQPFLVLDRSVAVLSLSCVWLFMTPWTGACQASLSFIISWSLLELMSIESVMPSNHLILCLICFSCLQSFPASESFQQVSSLHQVAKVFASGGQSIRWLMLQHQSFQWRNIQGWFLGAYITWRLAVRSCWWGTKELGP